MMEEVSIVSSSEENINQYISISNSSVNPILSASTSLMLSALRLRDHQTMSRKRILKNLLVLFSSFFTFFLGFQSLSNLQSTMNAAKGIGLQSQAILFAASMISSLFLPELMIRTFGCKRTLVFMILSSIPFLASNYNPIFEVIAPASVLMGLAIGPLNTAGAFYVNEMALRYLRVSASESLETILARFFGMLSFFLENTQIWGNLISYYIITPGMAPITNGTINNCGVDFRVDDGNSSNPNLQPPTDDQRYILVSVYILVAVIAAALVGLFMDKLENDVKVEDGENKCVFVVSRLLGAVKQACRPDQILLLPVTILCGMELAFYTGDFTRAYIACSWGVHHVGFVTVCFGVCGALMSLLVGPLVKCVSQMAVLILAACANISMCIVLFLWEPSPDFTPAYFIIAGVWGMGDAIWWSQVTALYGLMFPNDREAAFSNLYFWSFLGFFLSYSYANYFTVAVKISILLCFLVTGMIGYLVGQLKIRCTATREYVSIPNGEEE